MTHDLILKGGRVIDPSQKHDGILDVAFTDGKVSGFGKDLKGAKEIRDVSGYIVSPGLIDLHTHVYWGGTSLGIDADEFCRLSGVTTSVDTGSAGPGNWPGFRKHVIEQSQARILAYLHVSHAGIYGFDHRVMVGESGDLRLMNPCLLYTSPFPKMLLALAKNNAPCSFVMPERIAKTDPFTQITEYIGSGPMKFMRSDWVPGAKAVFEKFADYKPRSEKADWLAGGKNILVDRVECCLLYTSRCV